MLQEDNTDKKTFTENFADIFRAFGQTISEIFDDPELKKKAKEFADAAAESANIFRSRFKDADVKDKLRDARKAAEDFGKNVADYFKKQKGE